MMVRLLAQVIARGSDEILPAHIQADRLDVEPLLKSGVAVFKRLDLDGYVCRDCAGYEDCFRVYSEIGKDGKKQGYTGDFTASRKDSECRKGNTCQNLCER